MSKRLFRSKPSVILIVAAISGAAVAAEERGDAADTLVTSAISYTASSPAVALEVAQLHAVLEATHQVVTADLKQTTEALFHTLCNRKSWHLGCRLNTDGWPTRCRMRRSGVRRRRASIST